VRRLLALLLVLSPSLGGAAVVVAASPAGAESPVGNDHRGLRYNGLTRSAPQSACRGEFELAYRDRVNGRAEQVLCTHGPDPAPDGVDVLQRRGPDTSAATAPVAGTAAATTSVPCYGTGSDGYRVQLIYARSSAATDRYATYAASFQAWAARVDDVANQSAAETGGTRHVRFVTDAACSAVVDRVTLSASGASDFNTMISELRNLGYSRTDRKYLVWVDANVYCGIAQVYNDDSASPTPGANYSNGNTRVAGEVARVDNGCWGMSNSVEAHELMHNLGGVQLSAPHATPASHCTDDADRMCYADGSVAATAMQQLCAASHEALFDCNHDDYYNTNPAAGSYLATHWNSANSVFLTAAAPSSGPATTTTTVAPTTTTTRPPVTTTTVAPTTTTTRPPVTTTTVAPTTTTTTRPPTTQLPSAPQSLVAAAPASGPGVALSWRPPATGTVTGYRIYRSTSPWALAPLTVVGNVTSFTDQATARGVYYFYVVRAVNAAGEGPASNLAYTTAR
jgi:hypothetical protein